MEQLQGDRATWRFGGDTVLIRYNTGRRTDPVLDALGQCEVPVAAIESVEFRTGQRRSRWRRTRDHWRLRLRLAARADPYAAVGAMLRERSDPFLLTGDADTELLAEYHAEQLHAAATTARELGEAVPPNLATSLVPPVPLHIETVEGVAGFDGRSAWLVWSGPEANSRKRGMQRREFAIDGITRAEWGPARQGGYGYLRLVEHPAGDAEVTRPDRDPACLCYRRSAEEARVLLMAATVTAHTRRHGDQSPAESAPGGPGGV